MTAKISKLISIAGVFAAILGSSAIAASAPGGPVTLGDAYDALHAAQFVDLTHSFAPGIPHFSGFGDETVTTVATIPKDGFTAQLYDHVGQWGTHVDAPAHFHEGLRTVDQIDPKEFLLKLVVLDVHDKVASNPDYSVSMKDVAAWEARHGEIPPGAFVALRTDWSKRWPDAAAMQNKDHDGVTHYPGWSLEVLKYLFEVRHVTAIGHETTDTDPGVRAAKDDFSLESYVLGTNHYQIEMLANLDRAPEAGALIMVSFPKPENGAGFPARAVAIIP